jgi:hypothetical protein
MFGVALNLRWIKWKMGIDMVGACERNKKCAVAVQCERALLPGCLLSTEHEVVYARAHV